MAKEQNLSLNPTKISGLCGRLMCCLKYEQDCYSQTLKKLPKVGKDIVTPDGVGVLAEINAIRERVKVRIKIDDDFDVREYAIDEVRKPGPDDSAAVREAPKPKQRPPRAGSGTPRRGAGESARSTRIRRRPRTSPPTSFLGKAQDGRRRGQKKGEAPQKRSVPRASAVAARARRAPRTAAPQPPADAQAATGAAPAPQPSAPPVSAPAPEMPAPAAPRGPRERACPGSGSKLKLR